MFGASKSGGGTPTYGDPYFNYVTALLPGNGTNGAQNNTFVDSSANNFTVTRYGNTTQGTFSPFGNLWSNYFTGTNGNYIGIADNVALQFGSGDFTIEFWINLSSTAGWILGKGDGGATASLSWQVTGTYQFYHSGGTTSLTAPTLTLGTWYHIAAVRNGATIYLYVNGVLSTSGSIGANTMNTGGTNQLSIGTYSTTAMNGLISNFRIVKGTAVYTSAFTPPTAPLTAITNTSVLTCQSNRFVDNSSNNFPVTVYVVGSGAPSVQRFSPFGTTSSYSPATIGGSGYFDGTGDTLSIPTNAALVLNTGSAPTFTIELWVYNNAYTGNILDKGSEPTVSVMNYRLSIQPSGTVNFDWGNGVLTYTTYATPAGSVYLNSWVHIAVVSNAGSLTIYVNGVSQATGTLNSSYTDNGKPVFLGSRFNSDQYYSGYISNLRILNGTALYVTNFTVPTAPLGIVVNTSLLLNTANAGIIDNAMMGDYETVGNAQISTAQSKFGGGSTYFDGAGDYLVTPSLPSFNFYSTDFTVEFWLYNAGSLPAGGTNTILWEFYISTLNLFNFIISPTGQYTVFQDNGVAPAAGTSTPASTALFNQWHHLAVVQFGTTLSIYVNGIQKASATAPKPYPNGSCRLTMGYGFPNGGWQAYLNGYIDDFRVTKGYARYTANFNVPTSAYPTFSGAAAPAPAPATTDPYFPYVTALLHGDGTNAAQNNTFIDSSSNNFTITRNGNTTQGTFSPFGNLWSNSFDGNNDYLTLGSSASLSPGSGAFTYESWIYPNTFTQDNVGGATLWATPTTGAMQIGRPPTSVGNSWGIAAANLTWQLTSTTLPTNAQWNHIVVCRDASSNMALFLNGARVASAVNSYNFAVASTSYIGNTGIYSLDGYMSNVRFVKGTAVYDPTQTTLTVPTAPLTAIANTQLLTCNSNGFVDNSANNFTLTPNGGVSVQRFNPFSPTQPYGSSTIGGSGYFDGTGDILSSAVNSQAFNVFTGNGDFTVECWVYTTKTATAGSTQALVNAGDPSLGYGRWSMGINSSNQLNFYTVNNSGTPESSYTTTTTFNINTWNHFAVCKSGSTIYLFINGVLGYSGAFVAGTTSTSALRAEIGGLLYYGSNYLQGYISNARIVKDTALYTANFTPSTTPLTAVAGTSLLLNTVNAGIIDNAMINDVETVGNAQISTSVKKYGTGSLYFDGTGDYLTGPSTPISASNFTTGPFTVEGWVQWATVTNGGIFHFYPGVPSGTLTGLALGYDGTAFQVYAAGTNYGFTYTVTTGVWYHFAVVRYSGNIYLYINGTQQGAAIAATSFTIGNNSLNIGLYNSTSYTLNGYIDDFRVTAGVARYTSSFIPPTSAFPNQ